MNAGAKLGKKAGRGLPDSSATNSQGDLWNCQIGGSFIVRFCAGWICGGRRRDSRQEPTTCAFGGRLLNALYYITSATPPDTNGGEFGAMSYAAVSTLLLP
jgi:sugar lactone lactonase YvrE